jgi:hypothetical protein
MNTTNVVCFFGRGLHRVQCHFFNSTTNGCGMDVLSDEGQKAWRITSVKIDIPIWKSSYAGLFSSVPAPVILKKQPVDSENQPTITHENPN